MPRETAEASGQGKTSTLSRRSDRFLAGLEDFHGVTLVSHVHPDPDSLGSMVGLAHLIETCVGIPALITQDGPICRAENRAMVEALDLELTPIEKVVWSDSQAVVMVDSQPKTGRHSFNGEATIYAVIDHHQTPGDLDGVPFLDIRRSIGASDHAAGSLPAEGGSGRAAHLRGEGRKEGFQKSCRGRAAVPVSGARSARQLGTNVPPPSLRFTYL